MNWKKIFIVLIASSAFVSGFQTPVSFYGSLITQDSNIVSSITNSPVQLRGVSLGSADSSSLKSNFYNSTAISNLVDKWNAEMIRFPLEYIDSNYTNDSAYFETLFDNMIRACITKGVYAVVTWRSSHLHENEQEQKYASDFFVKIAEKYDSVPNLIFEIFERPASSSWDSIKSVQQKLISEIRKYSNNLIVVGTPFSSQDLSKIDSSDFKSDSNIAYSFQFNSGSNLPSTIGESGKTFEESINAVLKAGYPIFISQFTTTHTDGGLFDKGHYNTHDSLNAKTWLSFLDSKEISYIAASVSDEYLGSSFFGISEMNAFDQSVVSNWSKDSLMTPSGRFIFKELTNYALTAPWRIESSSSVEIPSSSSSAPLTSLIDDFTDGNSKANTKEYWYIYTDVNDKGKSTVGNTKTGTTYKVVYDDGTGNDAASIQDFSLLKGTNPDDPYVALGLNTELNGSSYFLKNCTEGFSYRYKGVSHRFRVNLSTVTDYNNHFKLMPAKSTWTEVVILPTDLKQDSTWGEQIEFDLASIVSFIWEVKKTPTSGSLWVDDFNCLGTDLGLQSSSSSEIPLSSSSEILSSSSETPLSSSSEILSSSSAVKLYSIIDDFTDGNSKAYTNEFWFIYTDVNDKGKSTVGNTKTGATYKVVYDDGTGNNAAVIQSFSLVKGSNPNDPYVALGINTTKNGTNYFLNKCTNGFSYRYKGVAHRFQAKLSTVKDYNYHYKLIPAKTIWTEVVVQPSDFKQDTWGDEVVFNPSFIESFAWEVKKTPTAGSLWVDDFYCLGSDLGINSSSSSALSSSSITTAIANVNPFAKWNISANNRILSLTLEKETSAWIDVFDLQGNLVMASRRINSDNSIISLETLPSGRYIARVRTNKEQMLIRLELH